MRLVLGIALCCLTLLAGPGLAQAAQRYAAPGATGVTCTQGEPCSLEDAINGASADDEVIVTAGEYAVTGAPINVVGGEDIHGDYAGPMPRIVAELEALPAINLSVAGDTLSYLEIRNEGTEAVGVRCFEGTRLERIRASGVGEGAAGANVFQGCAVRDSLFLAQGTNSLALESLGIKPGETGAVVRNVTAVATGTDSAGIQSRYNESSPGSHTLTLTNSIAQGASDLRTEDGNGPGRIVVSNSNFDVVKEETAGADHRLGESDRPADIPRPRRFPRGAGVADDRRRLERGDRGARPRRQSEAAGSGPRHRRLRVRPAPGNHGDADLARLVAEIVPAPGRRWRNRQQDEETEGGRWDNSPLRPDRRGDSQVHGRAEAPGPKGRRKVPQADGGQPRQEGAPGSGPSKGASRTRDHRAQTHSSSPAGSGVGR